MKKSILIAAAVCKTIVIAAFLGAPNLGYASLITVSTDKWSSVAAPSSGRLSTEDVWIRTEDGTPTKSGNSSGTLVSDFRVKDDFSFSGIFSPTFASNHSCEKENTCNDNDIIGLVFGWQDVDNHYRLGWNQGKQGKSDVTGRDGLFLVREIEGKSKTLINYDSTFWVDEAVYEFSISRTGSTLALNIVGLTQNFEGDQSATVPSTQIASSVNTRTRATSNVQSIDISVIDDTFTSGNLGVYTESQTGFFKSLNVQGTVDINAPTTFSLSTVLLALVCWRRRLLQN